MSFDLGLALRIAATVTGAQAISQLSQQVAGLRNNATQPIPDATRPLKDGAGQASISFGDLAGSMTKVFSVAAAATGLAAAIYGVASAGMHFNEVMEQGKFGIATLITAQATLTDGNGKQLAGQQALTAALQVSEDQMHKLRIAGLQTAATSEQLVDAFQQAVGAGLSAGLNLDQIRRVTVDITQAAGTLGVPMNQISQEVTSILSGTIDINSKVAKSLQITNEDVKAWKEKGVLAEKLQEKMQAFNVAGEQYAGTWTAVKSNMEEAFSLFAGDVTSGMFDRLKQSGQAALAGMFDVNNASLSSEVQGLSNFLQEVFNALGDGIAVVFEDGISAVKDFSAWLDENKDQVDDIIAMAKILAGQIWDVAKVAGQVVAFVADWAVQSGLVDAACRGIQLLIAGLQDGIRFLSAGFATIGGYILDYMAAPLGQVFELLGRGLNLVSDGLGDALLGMEEKIKASAEAAHNYSAQTMQDFADGKTKLAALTDQWENQGQTTDKVKTKTAEFRDVAVVAHESHAEAAKKAAKELEKQQEKYKDLIKTIDEKTALTTAEANSQAKLTDGQKLASKVMSDLSSGVLKFTTAQKVELTQRLEGLISLEQERDMREAVEKATDKYRETLEAATRAKEAEVEKAQDEYDSLGLSKRAIAENTLARMELTAAILQNELRVRSKGGADSEELQALLKQIDAQKELIEWMGKTEVREKQLQTAKDAAEEWKKTADQINQSLTDALMRGFESGKGFGENLRDTLVNMFKTMVLRPVISATVQGALGLGQGNALTGSGGGLGGLMNMAQNIYSMWSSGGLSAGSLSAGWMQDIASSGFGQSMGWANEAGQLTQGSADFIMNASDFAQTATNFVSWATVAVDVFKAFQTGDGWGKAVGAAVGTYILPGIGTMIGSVLGGVVDSWFGGGGDKQGGSAWAGGGAIFGSGNTEHQADTTMANMVSGLQTSLDGMITKLGGKLGVKVGLGYSADPAGDAKTIVVSGLKDANGNIISQHGHEDVGRSEDELKAALDLESKRVILEGLKASSLPEEFAKALSGIDVTTATKEQADAALAAINNILSVKVAFEGFAQIFPRLGDLSYDAKSKLTGFAGGLEALSSKLSFYYDNFYSTGEKNQHVLEQLDARFAAMGLQVELSTQGFRGLMDSINPELDPAKYAALLELAPMFKQLIDGMGDSAKGVTVGSGKSLEGDPTAGTVKDGAAEWWNQYGAKVDQQTNQAQQTTDAIKDLDKTTASGTDAIKAAVEEGSKTIAETVGAAVDRVSELGAEQAKALVQAVDALTRRTEGAIESTSLGRR